MKKRNKAMLCALASIGVITSFNTINANAMTNSTTKATKPVVSASTVEDWMYRLPYTFKMDIGEQLKAGVGMAYIEYAYNSLGDKQRYVDPGALYSLRQAERRLQTLFEGEGKALDMVRRIVRLEEELIKKVKPVNARAVNTNSLSDKDKEEIQKEIKYLEDTYKELDYSVRETKILSYFMNRLSQIECKLVELGLN